MQSMRVPRELGPAAKFMLASEKTTLVSTCVAGVTPKVYLISEVILGALFGAALGPSWWLLLLRKRLWVAGSPATAEHVLAYAHI